MDVQQVTASSFVPSASAVQSLGAVQSASRVQATQERNTPEPSAQQLAQAVSSINNTIQVFNPSLFFSVDSITDKLVVQVKDKDTDEVVRQIPTKEALNIARTLDVLQGLLFRERV